MPMPSFSKLPAWMLGGFVVSFSLLGCATNSTSLNDDPWEGWNRDVHGFNHDFDEAVLKPVAKGYQNTVPNPVDESITNVFSNINDIGVTINDFLQFKFLQGGMDASRFLINTTAGVVGIFDVAKHLDLPKHDEDFGQTLGVWGVPSGSYMVLPFIGASTPRDAVGLLGDALFNPLTYVSFFGGFAANIGTAAATGVDITDTRSDIMSSEKIVNEASVDRYDFIKSAYLQRREYLIYDGNPPEDLNDPLAQAQPATTTDNNALSNDSSTSIHDPQAVTIIDHSTKMPESDNQERVPVINNSRHFLELSEPD